MAKKSKGHAKPGSTVTKKVGKRTVKFVANKAGTANPGKLVPRYERPDIKSNSIPGFPKAHGGIRKK